MPDLLGREFIIKDNHTDFSVFLLFFLDILLDFLELTLAHYLEHLMFKGTQKFGTTDHAKEKPYLDEITRRYESYRKLTDPARANLMAVSRSPFNPKAMTPQVPFGMYFWARS